MYSQASFGDFIYIILGLGWVIFSAYNAKKKQNAKKNPPSANDKGSFLETLMSEIGGANKDTEPVAFETSHNTAEAFHESDPQIIPTVEDNRVFSYDDEYEEDIIDPPSYNIDNEPVNSSNVILPKNRQSEEKVFSSKKPKMKRIDLRKAVVYSEILKRVYF